MTLQFSLYIDTYFLKYNSNEEIKLQNLERKLRTKRDKIGYTFPLILMRQYNAGISWCILVGK